MNNRSLAIFMIVAALCIKAAVPAGYMLGSDSRTITVQICKDGLGPVVTKSITIPMSGDQNEPHKTSGGKGECVFSALSMHATAATPLDLLATALLFILALGFSPVIAARTSALHYLRPPLRGPPACV